MKTPARYVSCFSTYLEEQRAHDRATTKSAVVQLSPVASAHTAPGLSSYCSYDTGGFTSSFVVLCLQETESKSAQ